MAKFTALLLKQMGSRENIADVSKYHKERVQQSLSSSSKPWLGFSENYSSLCPTESFQSMIPSYQNLTTLWGYTLSLCPLCGWGHRCLRTVSDLLRPEARMQQLGQSSCGPCRGWSSALTAFLEGEASSEGSPPAPGLGSCKHSWDMGEGASGLSGLVTWPCWYVTWVWG